MLTPSEWQALRLTLTVAAAAVAASLPLAVAIAWWLAKYEFRGKFLVETVCNLPLVLPPVVTGYLLLMVFGRRGGIGFWLEQTLGMRFVFDWKGAAIASAVVGFPLLVRPIRQAFVAVDDRLLGVARTLGARPFDVFCTIALPLARPGILSGSVLAFARSMGEFGATVMIAGNIPGQTRTIPLHIYTQLDAPGGIAETYRLIITSVVVSASALIISEWCERRGLRTTEGSRR